MSAVGTNTSTQNWSTTSSTAPNHATHAADADAVAAHSLILYTLMNDGPNGVIHWFEVC